MKFLTFFVGSGVLAAVLVVSTAQAAIVYVDAVLDPAGAINTTDTSGNAVPFTLNGGSGGTGADGRWRVRTTLAGNGSSLIEANGDFNGGANNENAPRLRTRISGLAAGTYNVYAYFVGNHPDMRLAASLTNDVGHLPVYTVGNGGFPGSGGPGDPVTDAELANFANVVTNDNGFAANSLYQIFFGTASTVGGNIDVFIDDDTTPAVVTGRLPIGQGGGGDGGSLRSVYEGVGYELVALIPEPSSLLLLVLGCVAAAATRRR